MTIDYDLVRILKKNGFPLKTETIIKNDLATNGILQTDNNRNVTAGPITKNKISDFPSTMPPSAHSHVKTDITDFPQTIPPSAHTHIKSEITDFPQTMPPSAHTHTVSQITNFPSTIPPSEHSHTISEISDFPQTMTPSAHNHNTSNITNAAAYNHLGTAQNATQATINNAINTKIGELTNMDLLTVVQSLPTASSNTMNKLYLVASQTSSANNVYDIYITVKNGNNYTWEKIDDASLSLTSYAKKTELPAANTDSTNIQMNGLRNAGSLNSYAKADHVHPSDTNKSKVTFSRTLTSGTKIGSINIDGTNTDLYCQTNTDTTYTAGSGLSLGGNQFKHSNSITATNSPALREFKYDSEGHITASNTLSWQTYNIGDLKHVYDGTTYQSRIFYNEALKMATMYVRFIHKHDKDDSGEWVYPAKKMTSSSITYYDADFPSYLAPPGTITMPNAYDPKTRFIKINPEGYINVYVESNTTTDYWFIGTTSYYLSKI